MKDLLLTLLHLTVMTATLCGRGGVRAVIAENLVRAARKLDQYAAQKVDHLRAFILCGSDRATVSLIPPSASSRQREPAWAGERPPRTAELHASM